MNTKDRLARFAAKNQTQPPRHLGQRYNRSQFLPQAGNTVVCHLDTSAPSHTAILETRARMQNLPEADRLIYTPASSLHMTVFEGVIETRRSADAWPKNMDRDTSVEAVTQAMIPRFAEFTPPPEFSVKVVDIGPSGLAVAGATPRDENNMLAWREALSDCFGYRQTSHDAYRFHMTFAYPLDWLSEQACAAWETELESLLADLAKAAPVIPLKPPAFCRFADMTHFEELSVLEG